MIVLDEQLKYPGLNTDIHKWYQGSVRYVSHIWPNMVIKDESIPRLLNSLPNPTFVTIDDTDFWKKVATSPKYCVICFTLSHLQLSRLSSDLRSVLRLPQFRTKLSRMGC